MCIFLDTVMCRICQLVTEMNYHKFGVFSNALLSYCLLVAAGLFLMASVAFLGVEQGL